MPLAASETVVSHAIFMQMHEGETGMMQLQAIEKSTLRLIRKHGAKGSACLPHEVTIC